MVGHERYSKDLPSLGVLRALAWVVQDVGDQCQQGLVESTGAVAEFDAARPVSHRPRMWTPDDVGQTYIETPNRGRAARVRNTYILILRIHRT